MKYSRKKSKREKQRGGWLNEYDFAYPGMDIVNSGLTRFKRIAPSLIQTATKQLHTVTEKKLNR